MDPKLGAMRGQKDSSERECGMMDRKSNPFFVARVFLYGMAAGLFMALVLWFVDCLLSHRLGEIVWGR